MYSTMTIFNPSDPTTTKEETQSRKNFGESKNKGADYTTPNKGFMEKGNTENSLPISQDAEKDINPLQNGSSTMRYRVADGIKIEDGFSMGNLIDITNGLPLANFSQFPGYTGTNKIKE